MKNVTENIIICIILGICLGIILWLSVIKPKQDQEIKTTKYFINNTDMIGTIKPKGVIQTPNYKIFMTVYEIDYKGKTYIYFEKSGKPVYVIPE